jgi:hypothetical protein
MTLVISGANASLAFLMADRRLTRPDGRPDDEANKVTVAYFPSGSFLVGITGLAEVMGLPTAEWFANALVEIGWSTRAPAFALEAIAERLSSDLGRMRVSAKWKRLSIVGIGFIDEEPAPVPAGFRLSNFQHHDDRPLAPAESRVSLERYQAIPRGVTWEPLHWFDGSGSDFLLRVREDVEAYIAGLHAGAHPSVLAHHAYRVVTGISHYDNSVGAQANAAYMTPTGETRYRYFTAAPVVGTLLPVIVNLAVGLPRLEYYGDVRQFHKFRSASDVRFLLEQNPMFHPDRPNEMPIQPKAALCACGSGQKARKCHRRLTQLWRDVPLKVSMETASPEE